METRECDDEKGMKSIDDAVAEAEIHFNLCRQCSRPIRNDFKYERESFKLTGLCERCFEDAYTPPLKKFFRSTGQYIFIGIVIGLAVSLMIYGLVTGVPPQ